MRFNTASLIAAAASATLLALPVWGASLRGTVTLQDPLVHLSDLFATIDHDRVLGPAPPPGGRIVVEAAQLAAIARQFNVDWRPGNSADRAILERPGAPFPRAEAMAALQAALAVAGVPPDADIQLPAYTPPMVPPDGSAVPEVGQIDYDPVSGRFTALLSITAAGMDPAHTRLSGRVQPMIEIPVATRRMLAGDVVRPDDLRVMRVTARGQRADMVQIPAQAVGMALRHTIGAGAPVPLADLEHPLLVRKNGIVTMILEAPGLAVEAQGISAEDGGRGDMIRVVNPASRALVTAEVIDAGRVKVIGGQPALLPPGVSLRARLASR